MWRLRKQRHVTRWRDVEIEEAEACDKVERCGD